MLHRTRNGRFAGAFAAAAAAVLSTAGCGSDPVPGTATGTAGTSAPPAVSAPAGPPGSGGAPGGAYSFVDGLCRRIDFSAVEAIRPFREPVDAREQGGGPFSTARCSGTHEPREGTLSNGITLVSVQWLPTPRLAAKTYENLLPTLTESVDRQSDLPGRWEQATLGISNDVGTPASYLLLQDSNLVIEVRLSFTAAESQPELDAAAQRVAESILTTSAKA